MSSTDGDDKLDVLQTPQEQVHKDYGNLYGMIFHIEFAVLDTAENNLDLDWII